MAGEGYPLQSLSDLVTIHDSKRIPVRKQDRKPGPYPYYGASGIVDYVESYIFDGDYLLLAEDGENLKTQNTQIAFMARGQFWVNNHAHILEGNSGNSTLYLCYALQIADINSCLSGSTRPKLTQGDMKRILVSAPPPNIQLAIAHILGSLDDKIELNRQMNHTLQQMAQAIFKSWFIDFDPVRAKAEGRDPGLPKEIADLFPDSFEESELGAIPKGWEAAKLADVINIHDSKRVPLNSRQRAERRGKYRYYGAAGIMDYVNAYLFDGVYVLAGEDGSVIDKNNRPVTQYVWGQFWVNNHAHVLSGKNGISNEYLYVILRNTNIRPFVTGAVQPKVNQTNLRAIPVVLPSVDLRSNFAQLIEPLFDQFRENSDELTTLRKARDILLPKLISGELPIPDAKNLLKGIG